MEQSVEQKGDLRVVETEPAAEGGSDMKALPSWDEAAATLTAYQERLTKATDTPAYDQAFRDSPPGVGVHEIDVEKIIRRVNPEELKVLGYAENELVGRPSSSS